MNREAERIVQTSDKSARLIEGRLEEAELGGHGHEKTRLN